MTEIQVMLDNKTIITALITGGFMLMVIIFNEVAFIFRDRRGRKKDFFNQFFSERLKTHEEIFRIMTKGGITYIDPKVDSEIEIKEKVESVRDSANEAFSHGLLFADRYIEASLIDLIKACNKIKVRQPVEFNPENEFAESVAFFNDKYSALLKTLREKSGVNLIEEVFESIPKTRENNTKKDNKKRKTINKDN